MNLLETLIGLILAVILSFILIAAIKDTFSKSDFVDQTRHVALLVESLDQDDSKTMLFDFRNNNAIYIYNAGTDQIEYAANGNSFTPYFPPATFLVDLKNHVRSSIKSSSNAQFIRREAFKSDCVTATCLCLCDEHRLKDKEGLCSGEYNCIALEKNTVPIISGAALVQEKKYQVMMGGEVLYAGSDFGPPVNTKGKYVLRAERYLDSVVLCFAQVCFTPSMKRVAELEYISKNPKSNLNAAIKLALDNGKVSQAFQILNGVTIEDLRKNVDVEVAKQLLIAMKSDLTQSEVSNLRSFVVYESQPNVISCSMDNAQSILELIKLSKYDEQLLGPLMLSFLDINDMQLPPNKRWGACSEFAPSVVSKYPLDDYADQLGDDKDLNGRLYKVYYWFKRGIQCNKRLECIKWSKYDNPFFAYVLDVIDYTEDENLEARDPLRIYYYAAQLEHMSLQWGTFGDGEFSTFQEDAIKLGPRHFTYSKEQLETIPVWIDNLDGFLEQIKTYYENIISSENSEDKKAVARQVIRHYENVIPFEKAKLLEISGETAQAIQLRLQVILPVKSLPAVGEQYASQS